MDMCALRRVSIPVTEKERLPEARQTVLLLTADADLRAAAGRALEAEGYRVVPAAHSGHALLACLRAARIDLLVTDLAMDDISGPALADRLRQHFPDLQALYFANAGTPECEGVLVRPFTRDELLSALLEGSRVRGS